MHYCGMDLQVLAWIEQFPAELDGQRMILRRLLELCEADANIRWLAIGCSLARGAGDRLSDLDVAMGVREEESGAATAAVRRAVDHLADLVESFHHQLPSVTAAHERIFGQYAKPLPDRPGCLPVLAALGGRARRSGTPVRAHEHLGFCSRAIPPRAEATVSDLDPARLLSAGRCIAGLLNDIGAFTGPHLGGLR
jgi:predicted nucleotidyltransferase